VLHKADRNCSRTQLQGHAPSKARACQAVLCDALGATLSQRNPTKKVTTASLEIELRVLDGRVYEWGLPKFQTDMAGAADLFACLAEPISIAAGDPAVLVPTGIAIHIGDPGYAAMVLPRSGLGHKQGLVLGNLVGLIDADYTGPLMVSLWNRSTKAEPIIVNPGDRIAQLLFVPINRPEFRVVSQFSVDTKRGAGGFGSTGLVAGESAGNVAHLVLAPRSTSPAEGRFGGENGSQLSIFKGDDL
jgi:dUTP pyrophosphatase